MFFPLLHVTCVAPVDSTPYLCRTATGLLLGRRSRVEKRCLHRGKRALPSAQAQRFFKNSGTELCYCALSLTAKLYLGWFLLINVLFVDGTVDEALTPVESV